MRSSPAAHLDWPPPGVEVRKVHRLMRLARGSGPRVLLEGRRVGLPHLRWAARNVPFIYTLARHHTGACIKGSESWATITGIPHATWGLTASPS